MEVLKAKLNSVRPSKNRKFLVVELLKDPHPYGIPELKQVDFLFFKADDLKMH